MKWLWIITVTLLLGLQYRLWVGEGSLGHVAQLKQQIQEQERENRRLAERNRTLTAEVVELKQGLETIEERARQELGLIKEGETLIQLSGE
ncbi:MAG: cell division protein FtsB [Pseudomonadaceae bacterium]|nr:MAG: cell division protein FtsB [Pseudomonadaceae bacterium]